LTTSDPGFPTREVRPATLSLIGRSRTIRHFLAFVNRASAHKGLLYPVFDGIRYHVRIDRDRSTRRKTRFTIGVSDAVDAEALVVATSTTHAERSTTHSATFDLTSTHSGTCEGTDACLDEGLADRDEAGMRHSSGSPDP
jgi:hypothetical protein